MALCHSLVARPEAVAGRRVLELGAGTGLPSLLCARHLCAAHVIATDSNRAAVERLQAAAIDAAALLDFEDAEAVAGLVCAERVETVLLSDVFYPAKDAAPLLALLRRLLVLDPAPTILLSVSRRDVRACDAFERSLLSLPGTATLLTAAGAAEADGPAPFPLPPRPPHTGTRAQEGTRYTDPLYGDVAVRIHRLEGEPTGATTAGGRGGGCEGCGGGGGGGSGGGGGGGSGGGGGGGSSSRGGAGAGGGSGGDGSSGGNDGVIGHR